MPRSISPPWHFQRRYCNTLGVREYNIRVLQLVVVRSCTALAAGWCYAHGVYGEGHLSLSEGFVWCTLCNACSQGTCHGYRRRATVFAPPPGGGLVLVTIQGRVPFRRHHSFVKLSSVVIVL